MAKITISQSDLEEWFNDYLREQGQNRDDWERNTPAAARQEVMYRRYRDAHPEIEKREDLEIIPDENSKEEENIENNQKTDEPTPPQQEDGKQLNQEETPRYQQNFTSDEWQQLISGENTDFLNTTAPIRVGIDRAILTEMGKLPNNFADLSAEEQQDAINVAKADLKADERDEFNNRDIELKKEILEYYPPSRLVSTSEWLEEAEKHASTDEIKQNMESSRSVLMEVMVSKVNKYANGETIVDQTNIADVYDGAMEMYKYVEEKNSDNEDLKGKISTCRDKLEKEIDIYDEENGFAVFETTENGEKRKVSELTPEDAHEINETFLRAQKQAENKDKIKNPPEELASVWDNIEFEDDTKRQEFIDSFNESVIKKATMNVAVKNKGKKGDELDATLQEEIDKTYAAELTAMLTANEAAKHLAEEERKRQANPSYVPKPMTEKQAKDSGQRAFDAITNGTGGKYKVDNKVQVANFARYTNNAYGYLNRLGTKIGKKTNAVGNMSESINKFDKTCIKRFDPYYSIARTQMKAMAGNMGRQALNQLVRYGSSLVPGGNLLYGAYVGGQAIWRLGTKWSRLKKEAKKNNRKFSTLGFLKDHVGEIATSCLATGAALLGGAAAKDIASGLGVAAMAIGNLTNVIKTFKRQIEKGESWRKSASVAVFSAALSTGTALGTSYGLGLGMEAAGLGTETTAVADNDRIEELKSLNEDQLKDLGVTRQHDVDQNAEGAFLVHEGKEGYTTRDYTQEELDFAQHRMEKLFDENDSHTGGTRYSEHLGRDWTDNTYASNNNAYENAISSLDKLAETHPIMNSEIDGQMVSNSDMLLYKIYQANILAPNPEAISDSGQPIGEVLSYTDENGNTTTYQDTYHKLLNGEELTEADAKVIQIVEDHVGGQYAEGTNDMGKLKDFNELGNGGNPDSYNQEANVGYEETKHPGEEDIYDRFVETKDTILPFTMVHDNQGENRALAERTGANAKIAELNTTTDSRQGPEPTPVPPVIKKEQKLLPAQTQKKIAELRGRTTPTLLLEVKPAKEEVKIEEKGYGKLLADEYKIIYGVAPQVVDRSTPEKPDRAYKSWIAYNNRVDAERQATGRDVSMYDFLTERRQALDSMIENIGDTHTTVTGKAKDNRGLGTRDTTDRHGQAKQEILAKADYEKHKDNPAMAAVIADVRQGIMQSNISSQNYNTRMTLTHFMDYMTEHLAQTVFVSDGTRDISKNPELKRDIAREDTTSKSKYFVADLNDVYFPKKDDGKTFSERKEAMLHDPEHRVPANEAVGKMSKIHGRHDPAAQAQRTAKIRGRE